MESCDMKSLRKDMINELPEALILQILSSLPTKLVITTSVLSKRWRSFWKMVPKLEFESGNEKVALNIGKSLLSYESPVLESLHLKVRDRSNNIDVGLWTAFSRHVRELVLDVFLRHGQPFILRSGFFCSDTLETLKLCINSISLDVSFPVSMKSLRTLHLEYVLYQDDDTVRNLLAGCPNLEELLLRRYYPTVVFNFTIAVPSLKRLSIDDKTIGLPKGGYVINAPSLQHLNIENLKGYAFCLIENAPMLVEAKIRNVSSIVNEKILGSLKSAKRLSLDLSPLEIKFPKGAIFDQLVHLEMCTCKAEWWDLLRLMLDSAPKLQLLKLIHCQQRNDKFPRRGRKWDQPPKHVPECLLLHLETFVWKRFNWDKEEEKEMATYILRNARRLKKATFSINHIEPSELSMLEERRKMLNELDHVARGSDSCNLAFEFV